MNHERYRALCRRLKAHYLTGRDGLVWWEECEEVNPWVCWQGHGTESPRILLVGPDWGNRESHQNILRNCATMSDRPGEVHYFDGLAEKTPTDKNLIRLFETIGYPKIDQKRYEDLFFTNFIPGLRNNISDSKPVNRRWAEAPIPDCFRELVEILCPDMVICLGRWTGTQVLKALGGQPCFGKSFRAFLEQQHSPQVIGLNGKTIQVWVMAHPGVMGCLNRNRGIVVKESLELQIGDWQKIQTWQDRKG